ncbi:hypothetical protein [Bailinhaonella thermotolerans]|uniref:Uncharacterized protein n=1 Tax=Bailinhaonella thermotolerans TaxID=1070861 RepID=A0A3A4AN96_9ACTN|nr:hypothetical protein [Bailinhaonella thermotolerans]RJL29999.1 hypothetical protein D5H75_23965 [Bailinhaonella thermotolerans]
MKRKLLSLAGSLVLGAGLLTTTMSAPAAAAGPCSGTHLGNWPISGGYIAVYWNSSTGKNCAATYTNKPGVKQFIGVWIDATGGGSDSDTGMFSYYAGPASVYARGKCVSFMGQVGNGPKTAYNDVYCD